jgi:hypothetical protein
MRHGERGTGRLLHKGEVTVSSVQYEFIASASRSAVDARSFGPGPRRMAGQTSLSAALSGAAIPPELYMAESLELELEDGRRWPCYFEKGRLASR